MRSLLLAAVWCLTPLFALAQTPGPIPVKLVSTDTGFQLLRDGKSYFVKGVGGNGSTDLLKASGGNSLRTWGTEGLDKILDDAQAKGLTVAVGIWLGHERHGFNYNNADQVAEQMKKVREAVLRYKEHPAVLMWGLGNEMEGYENADNAAVWLAVNAVAEMTKKLDPNHPTMTVIAEIGGQRVKNLHRLCPDIDIIGINSYGGAATLPERYRKAGGTKPYLLTEFGPAGQWEVKKTSWGAAPEPSSTAKAATIKTVYEKAVLGNPGQCLGSFAFLWGHKQEATATWFGLLLSDGSRTGGVDVLSELWTGKPPANRCPEIKALSLSGSPEGKPGTLLQAKLEASDPDGDPLDVEWHLQPEAEAYGSGGDAEATLPIIKEAIVKSDATSATVKLPANGGGYRLFAYVRDKHHGAAVANVPLRVDAPVALTQAAQAKLPLVVYDEGDRKNPAFAPTGWMGNTKAIKLDENSTDEPHAGKTCLRCDYVAGDGWAGVVWQHPASDWGDRPGGWNLTGAKKLTFWARGAKGGEAVSFEFGLIGKEKRYFDTAKGKLADIRLTDRWQQFTIDLAGKDLTRIKTGFVWVVRGSGGPVTFYLDDVRYE